MRISRYVSPLLARALAVALALGASAALQPVLAQGGDRPAPPPPVPTEQAQAPSGPFSEEASVAVRSTDAPLSAEEAAIALYQQRRGLRRGQALMLVGATALVTGLIVGDTAGDMLVIGGAVIGLYGLYLTVQ